MPGLAYTTVRLLGQDPLAGRLPTADQLRVAEILDGAGFAYLEVSGGGCFDSAVRRGIESPWERIRALKARTKTPLGLARVLPHDPTGSLQPHRARELVTGLRDATGLPIGIYCQGSAGNALAAALEAARAGADLIACAIYPIALSLHRVSGEALAEA